MDQVKQLQWREIAHFLFHCKQAIWEDCSAHAIKQQEESMPDTYTTGVGDANMRDSSPEVVGTVDEVLGIALIAGVS